MAQVWSIEGQEAPKQLTSASPASEKQLENWIAASPGLVADGLRLIGQQLRLQAGILDLLALDPQGQLVVIETKRGRISRSAIAQALDYAAELSVMPDDRLKELVGAYLSRGASQEDRELVDEIAAGAPGEREVACVVVGTSVEPESERVVQYLSERYQVPIRGLRLLLVPLPGGSYVVIREGAEDTGGIEPPPDRQEKLERVLQRADAAGVGPGARELVAAAEAEGLPVRPYLRALMIVPPARQTHMLITLQVSSRAGGGGRLWLYPPHFAEYLGMDPEWVSERLSPRIRGEKTNSADLSRLAEKLRGLQEDWERAQSSGQRGERE